MTAVNDQAQLVGNYKQRYAPKLKVLFEQASPLTKRFKFSAENKVGDKYHQPVDLANEQGLSHAAPGILPSGANYLPAIAGQSQDAQVEPFQIHGRARVAYTAEFRSAEKAAAFLDAQKMVMKRLTLAQAKRHEFAILNGQEGWGQVTTTNPSSGASRVITVTDATWASGAFVGSIGMPVDVYNNSSGAPGVTKQTTGTSNGSDAITITAVDYVAKTLTLSCPNATDQSLNLASLWLFPETASTTKEMPGLGKIANNTGVLYNISAATYPEWAGHILSSIGVIDFAKLLEAHARMAPWFQPEGMSTLTLLPPTAWEILNTDQAALREYGVNYTDRAKNGFRGMTFNTQCGPTEVISHSMVRDSRLHICVEDEILRIGSTEHTFINRGRGGDDVMVVESSDSPSGEMRDLTELTLFAEAPRHLLVGTGITYT